MTEQEKALENICDECRHWLACDEDEKCELYWVVEKLIKAGRISIDELIGAR